MSKCWFWHNWPSYYRHNLKDGQRGYVDGINRHHIHLHRDCLDCGHREYADVHVPKAYVSAIDQMSVCNTGEGE